MGKTFVLVHGSWHGGWAWDAVARELSKKGHYPHAPTLVGHGPSSNRVGITHKDCVDGVTAYIRHHQLKEIVLVGHSFGGSVVQKVAEQLSDRIGSVVFVDALILSDNECVFDNLPAEYVAAFNDLASASVDNTMLIPWELWRDSFMQDAPESVARSVWEQLSPERKSGQPRQTRSKTVLLTARAQEFRLLPSRQSAAARPFSSAHVFSSWSFQTS